MHKTVFWAGGQIVNLFGFAKVLYFTSNFLLLEVSGVCVVLPSLGNPRVGVSDGRYLSLLPDWYHITKQITA